MADNGVDYVAVYGSLRRGMQAASKMERMEFVGQGVINASLFALGWYPGVKLGTDHKTLVDVFHLPEDDLLRRRILFDLDGYEGYSPEAPENSLFVRKVVTVDGLDVKAFVYEYNLPTNRPLVENGDWTVFTKEKAT